MPGAPDRLSPAQRLNDAAYSLGACLSGEIDALDPQLPDSAEVERGVLHCCADRIRAMHAAFEAIAAIEATDPLAADLMRGGFVQWLHQAYKTVLETKRPITTRQPGAMPRSWDSGARINP